MAGPMANLAPGHRLSTAWAMTCAVGWRQMWRPSGESLVMMLAGAPSGRGRPRSNWSPSTVAPTAALARRDPIEVATSAAVEPAGREREEPSGSVIVIVSAIVVRLL